MISWLASLAACAILAVYGLDGARIDVVLGAAAFMFGLMVFGWLWHEFRRAPFD